MDSSILKHAKDRTKAFQPNEELDQLISKLKSLLGPVQSAVNKTCNTPNKPIIVIVGCPRSGTTFMTQLLAATGAVVYPSNFLSRFSYAPHLGALIQELLLNPDYDLGNEFSDIRSESGFSSNVGKTDGALGINEFFHFWRRFFPNHDPGFLEENDLKKVKVDELRAELSSIEAVLQKPFMSKGMMLQYNLEFFAKHMPELKIIHVKREPLYVMQSISQARIKYYGTDKIWWSVKPRHYEFLKDQDPRTQVAGQVLYTDMEIINQTKDLPDNRFISVAYEKVCEEPKKFLIKLAEKFEFPELVSDLSKIQEQYTSGNTRRLEESALEDLQNRYNDLKSSNGEQ